MIPTHIVLSADPSRRQGERIRGAVRKTGAEPRTAKFEAGTWARKNARAWARKKRKNHEEGNPIGKVACRFRKREAQHKNYSKFETSFLSVQKETYALAAAGWGPFSSRSSMMICCFASALETAVNRLGPGQEGSARAKNMQIRRAVTQ